MIRVYYIVGATPAEYVHWKERSQRIPGLECPVTELGKFFTAQEAEKNLIRFQDGWANVHIRHRDELEQDQFFTHGGNQGTNNLAERQRPVWPGGKK